MLWARLPCDESDECCEDGIEDILCSFDGGVGDLEAISVFVSAIKSRSLNGIDGLFCVDKYWRKSTRRKERAHEIWL